MRDLPDPLKDHCELSYFYPEFRVLLYGSNGKAPNFGTQREYDDALALARLVREDGHPESKVIEVLRWLCQSKEESAKILRKPIKTVKGVRRSFHHIEAAMDGDEVPEHEFLEAWNAAAKEAGWKTAAYMSPDRRREFNARMEDRRWVNMWREGLELAKKSSFCAGDNDRKWEANIDWFLRPGTLAKILEGTYDDDEDAKPKQDTEALFS